MDDVQAFLDGLGRVSLQAGFLVVIVLMVQRLFRRHLSPRWRCALWLLVAIRLALPVSIQSSTSVFNALPRGDELAGFSQGELFFGLRAPQVERDGIAEPSNQGEVGRVGVAERTPAPPSPSATPLLEPGGPMKPDQPFPLKNVLFVVWLSVAFLLGLRLLWAAIRVGRLLSQVTPVDDSATLAQLEECSREMGVRTSPLLVESSKVSTPALCGIWRPRLILPQGLRQRLTPSELRFVFLHELAHLKRHDIAQSWVFSILQLAHWFNPLVWVAGWRLRVDRELACDALALETAGESARINYGETILRLLEQVGLTEVSPGVVGILESRQRLKQRLIMIAGFRLQPKWSWLAMLVVAGLVVVGLTDARESSQSGRQKRTQAQILATSPDQEPAGRQTIRIRGHVVDLEGRSLSGVQVESYDAQVPANCVTDVGGRFELKVAIHRNIKPTLTLSDPGFLPRSLAVDAQAKEPPDLLVRMYHYFQVSGLVRDADTGLPIRQFGLVTGRAKGTNVVWSRKWSRGNNGAFSIHSSDFTQELSDGDPPRFYIGVEASGYSPSISSPLSATDKPLEWNFQLKPGRTLSGVVYDADGRPCPNASIDVGSRWDRMYVSFGRVQYTPATAATDSAGRYEIPIPLEDQVKLFVSSKEGYADLDCSVLKSSPDIQLKKWGRIEGVVRHGARPGVGQELELHPPEAPFSKVREWMDHAVTTDKDGRFVFERVPEGDFVIFRMVTKSPYRQARVSVRAGETTLVNTTPKGRPAVFRLRIPAELAGKLALPFARPILELDIPFPRPSRELTTPDEIRSWYNLTSTNSGIVDWFWRFRPDCVICANADGSYALASVPEGRSRLFVVLNGTSNDPEDFTYAYAVAYLDIPAIQPGQEESTVDLGTLFVYPMPGRKVGDQAPAFTLRSSEGKTVNLQDYRGRYVVLDFTPQQAELARESLQSYAFMRAELLKNSRLSCLSFYYRFSPEDAAKLAVGSGITWPFLEVGPSCFVKVDRDYFTQGIGPSVFLIDPDGRIAAIEPSIEKLKPALAKALGSAKG